MRKIFTIPVGKLSKEECENSIKELMTDYSEEILWDGSKLKTKVDDVWIPYTKYEK